MDLIELVDKFKKGEKFEDFCKKENLNYSSEVIEVYMEKPLNLKSEVVFLDIEKTGGHLEYNINGTTFYNLFDFYYFQDFINEANKLSSIEIADRILKYVINDA